VLCPDPDGVFAKADCWAKEIYPVADQDYGYRLGRLVDPFGTIGKSADPCKSSIHFTAEISD
jgi:hypothetical protein